MIFASGNELLSSEAHFVAKNTQQWISKQGNVLIQFAYEPERPLIDAFTELKFNIQNFIDRAAPGKSHRQSCRYQW